MWQIANFCDAYPSPQQCHNFRSSLPCPVIKGVKNIATDLLSLRHPPRRIWECGSWSESGIGGGGIESREASSLLPTSVLSGRPSCAPGLHSYSQWFITIGLSDFPNLPFSWIFADSVALKSWSGIVCGSTNPQFMRAYSDFTPQITAVLSFLSQWFWCDEIGLMKNVRALHWEANLQII